MYRDPAGEFRFEYHPAKDSSPCPTVGLGGARWRHRTEELRAIGGIRVVGGSAACVRLSGGQEAVFLVENEW